MPNFLTFARLLLAAMIAGCAGPIGQPTQPGAPIELPETAAPAPPVLPPPRPSLESEQRRLAGLFEGTPVIFTLQADGSMLVRVPLRFSFDPARHAVKAPLAAVLDRIIKSQRDDVTRFVVTAPADLKAKGGPAIAKARGASIRDYMVQRGISASRFSPVLAGRGDAVIIVVADMTPP